MWLICRTTVGRGRNKLLVRGTRGAEWVFCPSIKNTKRDKVSISNCQSCRHFVRLEQTISPQTRATTKATFFRTIVPKDAFNVAKALSKSRVILPDCTSVSYLPSLIRERQPLVDVFEEKGSLVVLVELLGIEEKDLNITTDENSLTITAENEKKKYFKTIRLPALINRDSVKLTHKNCILQVRLKKLIQSTPRQNQALEHQ